MFSYFCLGLAADREDNFKQKVNEYDQEIPQSQTEDQPTAPRTFTVTRQPKDTKAKQQALFLVKMIAKLERA